MGESIRVACSYGECELCVGMRFKEGDVTWEIVRFTGSTIYSPSDLGGTPIAVCRVIEGEPGPWWQKYLKDGECEWCCDSIGVKILPIPEDWKRRSPAAAGEREEQ